MEGVATLRIVNDRLHVFDRRGECERPDSAGFAIESHYIVATCRAVLEHEHFPSALVAQIEQLVAGAPEIAGEIEIAGLERSSTNRAIVTCTARDLSS